MNLTQINSNDLHQEILFLVSREREILCKILWHLREVDRRKSYCDLRFGSLFEYCVKYLKYSEAQASRRVSASRLLREVPEIADAIVSGELNLTQLNLAKKYFIDENISDPEIKKKIFEEIKGKTCKETERILWQMSSGDLPRMVNVRLREDTVNELDKLRGLKAHSFYDLDGLLLEMCAITGKLWDPTVVLRKSKVTESDSRFVPLQVRAAVWERDGGKCTNCGSTYALELDHITPFALGGKTNFENLRLLCRNCNQRRGLVFFGDKNGKIEIGPSTIDL